MPATVQQQSETTRRMPAKPEWLKATFTGPIVGVDREAKVIRGYVMAQSGPFKTPGRGEFAVEDLKAIVKLAGKSPGGLKSRFAHPTLSDDGIGKFLGRAKNVRLDGDRVRGDLHLDPTSFDTPSGNLGQYVMDLAESDPDALSSSLVLDTEEEYRLNAKGQPLTDQDGNLLPPLWHPKKLHASDIVDTGDAVDGLLSADGLPDEMVRKGTEMLDRQFQGQGREVVHERCMAWLTRYLDLRFGAEKPKAIDEYRKRIEAMRVA